MIEKMKSLKDKIEEKKSPAEVEEAVKETKKSKKK